ncbi:MAG TPA: hypothetical protein VIH67_15595 [Candidatus Acidoferrum sp.]
MNKTPTTLNPAPARPEATRQEQWEELRSAFPIYLALAKQLEITIPFPQDKRNLPEKPTLELLKQVQTWLDGLDSHVLVHQLRHLLQQTTLNASESGLRALIQRHLRKPSKTNIDRDKIDFLLVQYFALCAPAKIYHKQIELEDTAAVMKPVLGETDTAPLAWCEPLEKMITSLRAFRSLRDMFKNSFIAEGRKVKEAAGGMFYDPSALLTFIRFNFLLRRTLIELMHADLIAIRSGVQQLEAAGARTIDCRQSGLTNAEPLAKIAQWANEWKQPFQKNYTERTVNETFEKLLSFRSDVEKALEQVAVKSGASAGSHAPASTAKSASTATKTPAKAAKAPEKPEEPEADPGVDFENCLEQIWEQLIATPPTRGRSMTTVKIGRARILMSSWEVTAFVSEDGPAADDLRRAVVARAMLSGATEAAKETGNATGLDRALSVARVEVSRLQERVDVAKQAKDTEAAVNLGISTKRLLSALDEAEKL